MRCSSCRSKFSAAWTQPAPGGSSPPGIFLIAGIALLGTSVLTLVLGHNYVGWACFAIGALVLVKASLAWFRLP